MFVTDYDGTLFTDEMNLKINKRYLLKLHKLGYIITISTGRSFESIKEQIKKYDIYYDYLSCADGSIIFDKDDNLLYFSKMPNNIIKEIYNINNNTKCKEIQFSTVNKYINEFDDNLEYSGINIVIDINDKINNDKFIQEYQKLENKYPEYNYLCYLHDPLMYYCIKEKRVNKSSGISFLKDYLKFNNDIYVIGDSSNDYDMIKDYNGVSIISDNNEIKEISKKQYNQVYQYIEEIISK